MPTITDDPDIQILEDVQPELDQPWNVIVFDDPVNYMGFVAMVIRRVFGYSQEKAETLMLQVHEKGKSIVWSGVQEKAEFYVQQLQGYHLNASMQKPS
ncbi:MAG: ATP-dependent Clp protease adapter ClpS [Verrucomicrobiota bacterium]